MHFTHANNTRAIFLPPGRLLKRFTKAGRLALVAGVLLAGATLGRAQTLDTGFDATVAPNVQFTSYIYATAVQQDGKILIGGMFNSILGVTRNNIARLNANGTLDMTFNPNADMEVDCIAVQPDGKILVGGFFNSIGGQTRPLLARLDGTTGAADTAFNANAVGNNVWSIAVQTDGNIVVGGSFTTMGAQLRNNLARLGTTGAADSFNPNVSSTVRALAIQRDGKILAGGVFTMVGATTRNRIARFDSNGTLDTFDPNVGASVVRTFAIQADGKILVGGQFNTTIGGQARSRVARLDPTTGLADSFNPSAGGNVYSIVVQADTKILLGGIFTSLSPNGGGATTRNRIARVNADGTLDTGFDPDADESVYGIALQTDGKLLVGGGFLNIGGGARSFLARLNNNTAATQSLGATTSSVTWTRGGSSVQFNRVTFESSPNNVTYTALGAGTPSGSDWTLTGLSLPTGSTFYIRARGYYRSGYHGGSESASESVQSFVLGTPPAITSTNNTTFTVGSAGSFTVTTTGTPSGASMVISSTGALPGGVTFTNNNNGTATLAGNPNAGTGGSYPLIITANNGIAPNATQNFTLTVNQPPAITSANNTTFTVGINGSFTVTKSGFPSPTLSMTGALPTGVTFTPATGALSGTPAGGTGGSYPLTFTAMNGVGSNAMQSFSLSVMSVCPTITLASLSNGTVGTAYSSSATASGGTGPYTYLVSAGALPSGLALAGATISGTPLATGSFQITATDTAAPGTCTGVSNTAVIGSVVNPGDLVIREFRSRGPAGIHDEYVKIANTTTAP
ncbi:MAG: putative Ig domain-containing protein, partial [Vicinamibacteria bacterium]